MVETNNGILIKSAAGKYIVQQAKPGTATITIKRKMGSKMLVVGERKFRVKDLPLPLPMIAGKHSGNLSLNLFNASVGILLHYDGFDWNGSPFKILKFSVSIVRNGKSIFNHEAIGNKFDTIIGFFSSIKVGDLVIFDNIYCKLGTEARERKLEDMEFTIN